MGIATATVSASNLPTQVTTDDPQGEVVFPRSSSLGSFFGGTPVAQPSGAQESAVTAGQQTGSVGIMYSNTTSPTAVQPTITAEDALATFIGTTSSFLITTGDILIVNKIAQQAGLGVGNTRVSASNSIGITFSNFTATTITPTATNSYGAVVLRGLPVISATLSPVAVQPNTIAEQQFAVPGLIAGVAVQVTKPTSQANIDIMGCRVVSANVLGITFGNVTATTTTPTAAESYSIFQLIPLDAHNNSILIEEKLSPTASTNTVTSVEQGLTITGLATTDVVVGVTKPTAQTNFGIVGWRVSAANTLGLTIANFAAATVTPTASEVYGVAIYRPNPVAPLVVYTQTLTPVAVAANTTAEQTFTVTGLVASSLVWVNKTSWTNGLGVVGVRVSALNTLAINYGNVTAASITPPSEPYIIANFQVPVGDAGGVWVQEANPASTRTRVLANATRSGLAALSLIAGE